MRTLLAGSAMLLVAVTPAWAQVYIEGAIAHTFGNEQEYNGGDFDVEDSLGYGGAIGWNDLLGPVDVELDLYATDRGYDGFSTDLRSLSVMANAIYDIPAQLGPVNFYVGGGLGAVLVEYDGGTSFPAFSDEAWVFGWQALAGGRANLGAGGWSVFGEWRYQDTEDAELAGIDVEYSSHSVLGGVRYTFQ